MILAETDAEYLEAFRQIGAHGSYSLEGMHWMIESIPVQVFPTSIDPLYANALTNSITMELLSPEGDIRFKVPTKEHLAVLFLKAFRIKDRQRIVALWEQGLDTERVLDLIARFDDGRGTLAERYRRVSPQAS